VKLLTATATLLVFILPTAILPAQAAPTAPSALYGSFIKTQRAREEQLRNGVAVTVTERHSGWMRQCVCAFKGSYEKYVIRKLDGADAATIAATRAPELIITDGNRALFLAPNTAVDRLWDGTLTAKFDPGSARSGGLHCGFLFGERWLSEYLQAHCTVVREIAETRTIELSDANTGRSLILELTEQGHLARLRELRDQQGKCVLEFSVDAYTSDHVPPFPASGKLQYMYGAVPTVVNVGLTYSGLPDQPRSLDAVPIEVGRASGAMRVIDELSGIEFMVGDEAVVEKVREIRDRKSAAARDAAPSGGGSADTLTLMFVTLAGAVIIISLRLIWRRRNVAS
jgi:hypothetical protein